MNVIAYGIHKEGGDAQDIVFYKEVPIRKGQQFEVDMTGGASKLFTVENGNRVSEINATAQVESIAVSYPDATPLRLYVCVWIVLLFLIAAVVVLIISRRIIKAKRSSRS